MAKITTGNSIGLSDGGNSDGSGAVIPEFGGPGDCGFFMHMNNSTSYDPGESVPGSELNYCCINAVLSEYGNQFQGAGIYPAGTWRVGGLIQNTNLAEYSILVCTRIDGTQLVAPHLIRGSVESGQVRNCRYANADDTVIDCEIQIGGQWMPFSAASNDCTDYGPQIFENAKAGTYGVVETYSVSG